ncbi:MAG: PrsW family intramembrane metalloprotease [Phycisphaerales bacterium]|nr:PrsW family intramembrane metalloprotease [Phycisphaerales bacterium]
MLLSALLLYGALAACAAVIAWIVVRYDLYRKEPPSMLLLTVGLGAAGMYLAGRVQVAAILAGDASGTRVSDLQISAMAGLTEELSKFGVVLLIALTARRIFDEPIDGLVYGSFAGLGAALEESVAVLRDGGPTMLLPMQEPIRLAGHLVFGGIGGFGIGLLVLRSRRAPGTIVACLLAAMMLHTLWDLVAFDAANAYQATQSFRAWHTAAAIGLMLVGLVAYRALVGEGCRMTAALLARATDCDV